MKKTTANGGVRRLGNGRSGAAPAVARPPVARRTFTETGDAPAAVATDRGLRIVFGAAAFLQVCTAAISAAEGRPPP